MRTPSLEGRSRSVDALRGDPAHGVDGAHPCGAVARAWPTVDRSMSTALRMSRSLELRDDGVILLHLLVLVAPQKTMGSYFAWESGERSAPVGSVEAEKMLEGAVNELSDALREGVDVFVEHVPAAGAGS